MKLATAPSEVSAISASNEFREMEFGIRSVDMGLILDILRSKMYSDPIKIICQEIAANARDANREVGKKKRPIRISFQENLNNRDQIDFVISDDGPGISPDSMENIFINYGASTKRNTNALTGGFGLGCKTPFAYTDSFSIRTIFDHVEYLYQAVIEKGRSGKLLLVSKNDTNQRNGTDIIIPINRTDSDRFAEESHRVTFLWDVRPEFINLPEVEEGTKIDTPFWTRVRSPLFGESYYALIDGIAYPLDSELLSLNDLSFESLMIKFKNGSIPIAANRESIHYDNQTIPFIKKSIEECFKRAHENIQQTILNFPTKIEALTYYGSMLRGLGKVFNSYGLRFKYCDEVIKDTCFDYLYIQKVDNFRVGGSTHNIPEDLTIRKVYYMDMQRRNKSRNENAFKESDGHFYLVHCDLDNPKHKEEYGALCKYVDVSPYSKIPFFRAPRGSRKPKEKSLGLKVLTTRENVKVIEDVKSLDPNKVFFFPYNYVSDFRRRIDLFHNLELLLKIEIILVKVKDLSPISARLRHVDAICNVFRPRLVREAVRAHFRNNRYKAEFYSQLTSLPKRYQKALKIIKNYASNGSGISRLLKDSIPVPERAKSLTRMIDEIERKYPLVEIIGTRHIDAKVLKELNRYIRFIIDEEVRDGHRVG